MNFQQQIAQSLLWRGLYFVSILVMNIFLSRYLEAGNSGWIFYLCNNFSFLLILVGLTMESGVNYYASRNSINHNKLSWFSILWTLMVAAIVFVGLWFYFGRYKDTSFLTRAEYLYFALSYITGIQLTSFFTVLFYANKNFVLPNLIMVLLNIAVIVLIPKQVGTGDTNTTFIIHAYFGYFLLTGIALATAFMFKSKSWQQVSIPSPIKIRLLLKYAWVALAANIIFFLVYRVDYWFVKRFASPEALGNYIQVSKLGQMLLIVPSIIASVVFPHTAGGMNRTEMKENILRIGRITTLLYIVLFTIIALVGQWLFPFVFGKTYEQMYVPFLLLIPGVWALSNLYVLSAYFGGINKVKINVQGALISLLFILLMDYLFIPAYGIIAAATISSVGYIINFMFSFKHLQKEHPVSIEQYWKISKDDLSWLKTLIVR